MAYISLQGTSILLDNLCIHPEQYLCEQAFFRGEQVVFRGEFGKRTGNLALWKLLEN